MGRGVVLTGAAPFLFVRFRFAGNCAGRFGERQLDTGPAMGGAMEEESVDSKGAKAVETPGPEKGSDEVDDVIDVLVNIAETALEEGLVDVVKNLADMVKEKHHVPPAKLLLDLVERLNAMKQLPRVNYESFAAVLWKECRVIEGESPEIREWKELPRA